ncbi:heterokaryon incompatibility protein-domain-containing protein [Coniella lustricola]|uniref:Heterokaryon incompatibility protein-domain-containing protein n=1 Tax=Coniella lustricola TaxID=2025994 RepID=A0A2T3A214_9PEZI|nr:heterokaryon incompatibility protein-domain-containing protein [Coniella lustricola]
MRLLKYCSSGEFELTGDLVHDIPEYAILSHTWNKDPTMEITYQDLVNGTGKDKPGYTKIEFCGRRAKLDNLQYFWIDTCCIDKSNLAELVVAINSMFRWYQKAARCYVYLSDVSSSSYEGGQQSELVWGPAFRKCLWFSRGWTLQELLGPVSVEFFANDEQRLGDKRSLEQQIHKITGISLSALRGCALSGFSIEERFRWAELRQTTREEDWAYCLQGIFGISMSVTYGEGKNGAIHRLHEKINEREACLRSLRTTDPRDDKTRIEETKGGLLQDSYKWILDHQDFKQWRDHDQSQLLWIKGDPGKGKTMLLCGIINELSSSRISDGKDNCSILSYFFCQATDSRINKATDILRGLIYMFIDQQPLLYLYVQERYSKSGGKLFEDTNAWVALTKIFKSIILDPLLDGGYVIIDALDECSDPTPLLGFVDEITRASSRVKWIISSRNRPEDAYETIIPNSCLDLEFNELAISAAVRNYTKYKVERLAKKKGYDSELQEYVYQFLSENSGGTFLWVALVCQELAPPKIKPRHVQDKLQMLYPGLNRLYEEMLNKAHASEDSDICRQILVVVSLSFRPLTLSELASLIELPDTIKENDLDTLQEMIRNCGSFLTIRKGIVYFVHQSAKDFLLEKEILPKTFPLGTAKEHEKILSRSIKSMSQNLRRNIYHLQHPGILIDQVRQPQSDPLAAISYSCIYWMHHLLEIQPDTWLQDDGSIHKFLRERYLYWLEALSLLRSFPQATRILAKLKDKLQNQESISALLSLVQDMQRFLAYNQWSIENSPLQIYTSALIFTPNNSLTKRLFTREIPEWLEVMPKVENNWNPCLQIIEGHSRPVTSVAFSGDGQRLASGYGISSDRRWILRDAENLIWLPFEYRPDCYIIAGSRIAIGCSSGRVLCFRFCS